MKRATKRAKRSVRRRAVHKRPIARAHVTRKRYVARPSQATRRGPSARLRRRRKANVRHHVTGMFPNPRPARRRRSARTYSVLCSIDQRRWVLMGRFPLRERAVSYARAMAKRQPRHFIKVE